MLHSVKVIEDFVHKKKMSESTREIKREKRHGMSREIWGCVASSLGAIVNFGYSIKGGAKETLKAN